jgi:hypothetical protein
VTTRSVAGGKATLSMLGPALLRLTYAPNSEVLPADAKAILETSSALVGGSSYAILVDMPSILRMSSAARALFGAEDKVLAAAMLGVTPMDRVLAASMTQAVHDVQFFVDEGTALRWLTGRLPHNA